METTTQTPVADDAPAASRRKLIWRLAGLALSVGLTVYLLAQIDLPGFLALVRGAPPAALAAAFGLYMLMNFFRALRFQALLPKGSITVGALYPITLYHNLLTRILPFRTGEVSYVVLLKSRLNQPLTEGVGSLIGARAAEFLLIGVGGAAALLALWDQVGADAQALALLLVVMLVAATAALYYAGALLRLCLYPWRWMTRRGPWKSAGLWATIERKLVGLAAQLDRMREPRLFLRTLLLSCGTYGANVAFTLVLMEAVGARGNFGEMLAVVSISIFAVNFPLSVSGFGVVEAGWTFGLVALLGMEVGEAASIGFFQHGCQLASAALSGLIGYIFLAWSGRGVAGAPPAHRDQ